MQQDSRTTQHFLCVFAHEHVVATDVRLALDAIEDQVLELTGDCLHQFLRRRKDGAAEPDDATLQYPGQQDIGRQGVERWKRLCSIGRSILAVTIDDDTRRVLTVAPRNRPGLDCDDLSGGRSMDWRPQRPIRRGD